MSLCMEIFNQASIKKAPDSHQSDEGVNPGIVLTDHYSPSHFLTVRHYSSSSAIFKVAPLKMYKMRPNMPITSWH